MIRLWPIAMCVMLVGCSNLADKSYFRNRAKDYHSAYVTPPLEVPDDLSSVPQYDQYPLPHDVPEEPTTVYVKPPFLEDEDA